MVSKLENIKMRNEFTVFISKAVFLALMTSDYNFLSLSNKVLSAYINHELLNFKKETHTS